MSDDETNPYLDGHGTFADSDLPEEMKPIEWSDVPDQYEPIVRMAMDYEKLKADLRELVERLQAARELRRDHDRNPTLQYCLTCDEAALAIQTESGENDRLDCRHDHYDAILTDAHDSPEVSAWIQCLEYFLGEDDD